MATKIMKKMGKNIERFERSAYAYVSVCLSAKYHMTNEFSNQTLWSIELAICLCLVDLCVRVGLCACLSVRFLFFILYFTIAITTIVMYSLFLLLLWLNFRNQKSIG